MIAHPITYVDRSRINDGKLPEVRRALAELAAFVESHEPRILSYSAYFSEDEREMTVVHVHPDSASLEHHMQVAGPLFARFAGLIELQRIDVYGSPSEAARDQLRAKAGSLGHGSVTAHTHVAGFARFG